MLLLQAGAERSRCVAAVARCSAVVVVHEPGHVVLELGPGLGVSVTELLQDQLLGKGPGHSKPVEGQKSFTNVLKNKMAF